MLSLEEDLNRGERKVEVWANSIGVKSINMKFENEDPFFNINTKDDLNSQLSNTSQLLTVDSLDSQLRNLAQQGGGVDIQGNRIRIVSGVNSHDRVIVSELTPNQLIKDDSNTTAAYAVMVVLLIVLFAFAYYISTFVGGEL